MPFQSLHIATAPTPAEVQKMRDQNDETKNTSPVRTSSGGGGRITFSAGGDRMDMNAFGTTRVDIKAPRPGMVTIPGVGETTRAAAIAAGLISEDGEADPEPRPGQPKAGGDDADKDEKEDADPAEVTAASAILQRVADSIGTDAVDGAVFQAAEAGDIPLNLPEGITAPEAESVKAGYVASAQSILGKVGSSVGMLEEMLSDDDLRHARIATVMGDAGRLQSLGREAQSRLASLPQRDPATFTELLDSLPPEWRGKVTDGEKGWRIDLGQIGVLSWGSAVRQGYVKL